MKEERDDLSSVNKADLEDMERFDSLRKSYRYDEERVQIDSSNVRTV